MPFISLTSLPTIFLLMLALLFFTLKALILLISLLTTIPAHAGAPFDAESLDVAHIPSLQPFLLMLAPLLMLKALVLRIPSLQPFLLMLAPLLMLIALMCSFPSLQTFMLMLAPLWKGLDAAQVPPNNHFCWCWRPLLMLKALMLLTFLPTTVTCGAGVPFDAEGLDAAQVPS